MTPQELERLKVKAQWAIEHGHYRISVSAKDILAISELISTLQAQPPSLSLATKELVPNPSA